MQEKVKKGLETCRKCGGTPKIIYNYPHEGGGFAWADPVHWIECEKCGSKSHVMENLKNARDSWNLKNKGA